MRAGVPSGRAAISAALRARRARSALRMAAQGEAEVCVVGEGVLRRGRRGQGHGRLADRRAVEHRRQGLGAGHVPMRAMPMPGQRAQGPGFGQALALEAVQRRAVDQVLHIGERPLGARRDDASGAVGGQAADEAEAEAEGERRSGGGCRRIESNA
jgi:hypothetical protein